MTTTDASPLSGLLLRDDGALVGAEESPVAHALLVTPVEAARRLSVGRTTIYALMASGELSSVTIGRCRRVLVTSLQAFVARLVDNASADGSR
jgi:excisionase family DNA binding protein